MTSIEIAGRRIGPGEPPYLIAEVGINHGGDAENARKLVVEAARSGADAVKLQTFLTAEFLAPSSDFFDVLASAELPEAVVRDLTRVAQENGVTLFSSAFDEPSVALMCELDTPAFKIASGDLTHLPLLAAIARTGRPLILSTGGATLGEIETALKTITAVNPDSQVALLHCVSSYPTDAADANLSCIKTMRTQFGVPVGFSDHTLGEAVAIAAVALGADVIEKHFTLDRSAEGPDHALSADPEGMKALAEGIKLSWLSVGRPVKAPVESADFIPLIRRSLNARRAIKAGEVFDVDMIAVRRPGTGIAPAHIERVLGKTARVEIADGVTITWDMVSG